MFILRATAYLAVTTAVAAAAALLSPRSVHLGAIVVDLQRVNVVLVLFISALVLVVAAYSARNLLGQDRTTRFGALLLSAFAGLTVMVTAGSLGQFALGWTVSGQATALLIAHAGSASARRASAYVRSWLLASDVLVWLAVGVSALPGEPQVRLDAIGFSASAAGGLLVLACIVRTGLVPAHRWLAQTAEAPSPVSAFLHAGIINAAGIAVVLWLPLLRPWLPVLLVSACLSVVVGLWTIRGRADVKGKLASSTTTQMAFMSIEAAVGLPALALLHLIGHGSYKSWCFLRAGGAITRTRLGRAPTTRSVPVLALAVAAAAAGVAGVWVVVGTVETLSAAVGVVACVSVVSYAAGSSKAQLAGIATIATLALGGYLALVHGWVVWLPVAHWQDTPALVLALVAIVVGATAPRVIPRRALHRVTWRWIAPRWMGAPTAATPSITEPVRDQYGASIMRLHELVDAAASSVAPAWPLRTAVAINPVQSLASMSFAQAALTATNWGASLYPSPNLYLHLLESGEITRSALEDATGGRLEAARLIDRTQALAATAPPPRDDLVSPAWESAHRWCQLAWSDSQADGDCFTLWHQALPRRIRERISPDPVVALHQALASHAGRVSAGGPPPADTGAELRVLQALLTAGPGWAAHAHWRGHDALVQLLALRAWLTYLHSEPVTATVAPAFEEAEVWQQALESSLDQWLTARLDASGSAPAHPEEIGVVMCIDVRSEPMRRALDRSGSVRTFGAAGFFGVDARLHINETTIDLAPVIVKPSVQVHARTEATMISQLAEAIDRTMSGVGGLAIAEGFGTVALAGSVLNTFGPRAARRLAPRTQPDAWLGTAGLDAGQLPLEDQIGYARRFLDGLGTADLPRLVAVAGHGADAANNAFAAAYQCGACGGNAGTVNARMVVSMLGDPRVREHLAAEGYRIQDTVFVAALHNTTSARVEVDPATRTPDTHAHLLAELGRAAAAAHAWLGTRDDDLPGPSALYRGFDWAQPFPEWGLVGNAACVIGPRDITARADLDGRVFLHEYDWTADPDGARLRGILQGPGVVMHMINMQYFCSTTDPRSFGSQDKTRHNVVGDLGVLVGASGDLHYGLPWQSLGPEAGRSRHTPVRLQIRVAAPPELLDRALSGTAIEQLAANGWLSIEPVPYPGAGSIDGADSAGRTSSSHRAREASAWS